MRAGGGEEWWLSPKYISSMKPSESSVWLELKIKERGSVLCAVRLLAAGLAGIHRCFFGRFQKAPKQIRMVPLACRETCVSAYSIIYSTVLHKMAEKCSHFLVKLIRNISVMSNNNDKFAIVKNCSVKSNKNLNLLNFFCVRK